MDQVKQVTQQFGQQQPKVLIVTGYSGAGKSTVLRALEDIGFFCVDNLPTPLLRSFFTFVAQPAMQQQRIALGIDIRGGHTVQDVLTQLRQDIGIYNYDISIFFLTSNLQALVKRFQETRRKHPLANNVSLIDAIEQEQQVLRPLIEIADITLDTSQLTIHELRKFVTNAFSGAQAPTLLVNLISFGFKYGVPAESNYVFDLRSLPNPYFVADLQHMAGITPEIQDYLFSHAAVEEYWQRLTDFLDFSIKKSYDEGRFFINVAIGCTGGRHRSVAFVDKLGKRSLQNVQFLIHHRDIEKSVQKG